MICFRDMAFCTAYTNLQCCNSKCFRAYTDEEAKASIEWGKSLGLALDKVPVAFADFSGQCDDFMPCGNRTEEAGR